MNIDAVLIAGPTASGKTLAALGLAEEIGGAVVNADSMQIYRELRVLTARPTEAQTSRIPHFLFGHVSVSERYSVARYFADAFRVMEETRELGRVPVFAGGTGLYFSALTEGLADIPAIPDAIRTRLRERMSRLGVSTLYAELKSRDPLTAARLEPADTQRILRAYEVFETTGRSLVTWQGYGGRAAVSGRNVLRFVLDVPRAELRTRIDQRFREMLACGARSEARALSALDPALPAAKILGLRELNAASAGEMSEAEAVERAIVRTQQFAKRQRTWFRNRMADWPRISAGGVRNIVAEILSHFK